jgi:hypothetical protein
MWRVKPHRVHDRRSKPPRSLPDYRQVEGMLVLLLRATSGDPVQARGSRFPVTGTTACSKGSSRQILQKQCADASKLPTSLMAERGYDFSRLTMCRQEESQVGRMRIALTDRHAGGADLFEHKPYVESTGIKHPKSGVTGFRGRWKIRAEPSLGA